MDKPTLSIIIVNYGHIVDTCLCLDSLTKVTYKDLEVIVVDNGSVEDRSLEFKQKYPSCIVINKSTNGGFASGVNAGLRIARGDYLMLLNNDTIVTPGFIEPLLNVFELNQDIGLLSPQICFNYQRDKIQYAGATAIHPILARGSKLGYGEMRNQKYDINQATELCNGACMVFRSFVLEDVGYFSEKYFMYYEEHDFTHRAKSLGWKCYYVGSSLIYHSQSGTIGNDSPLKTYYILRNRLLYQRTFQSGIKLMASTLYICLVIYPKTLIQKIINRDINGIKSVLNAVLWHVKNYKLKYV